MVGSSILPVAKRGNELFFLFGKENEMEDSAKGFSDFGGSMEKNESRIQTALREGTEELSGFFGDKKNMKKIVQKNGGLLHLPFSSDAVHYHVHILPIEYDPKIVEYFNHQHSFLWKKMNPHLLNSSKLFEKQQLKWFSVREMKTKKHLFRSFYREIVDHILLHLSSIRVFLNSKTKLWKQHATLHNRSCPPFRNKTMKKRKSTKGGG